MKEDFSFEDEFISFSLQDEDTRYHEVTQYHFLSWPDHGTPKHVASVVHFWQKIREGEKTRDQTWLVHCRYSALIVCDVLFSL